VAHVGTEKSLIRVLTAAPRHIEGILEASYHLLRKKA
jgi:hypothetical protein